MGMMESKATLTGQPIDALPAEIPAAALKAATVRFGTYTAIEELDAVIMIRVVRSTDDDPRLHVF